MSALAADFFADSPVLAGPLFAMLLFAIVFITAAIRAARLSSAHVEHMAGLVLEDERSETSDE